MKVILLDDVDNLGEAGEIVEVKPGYGRNWLIPQKKADFVSPDILNRLSKIKKAGALKRMALLKEVGEIIASLTGKEITIYAKAGQENRLFGAVTNQTISEEIKNSLSVSLDRKLIRLESPIKHLGEFQVELRASREIKGEITVLVKSEEEREEGLGEQASIEPEVATDTVEAPVETASAEEPTETQSEPEGVSEGGNEESSPPSE